mmetsp:Transcript_99577/g.286045  ORF Transcript_99577/g.286045 Transcript_99577/m.286045 type:complete len:137 (+) Transcript_99577:364-774(+)
MGTFQEIMVVMVVRSCASEDVKDELLVDVARLGGTKPKLPGQPSWLLREAERLEATDCPEEPRLLAAERGAGGPGSTLAAASPLPAATSGALAKAAGAPAAVERWCQRDRTALDKALGKWTRSGIGWSASSWMPTK